MEEAPWSGAGNPEGENNKECPLSDLPGDSSLEDVCFQKMINALRGKKNVLIEHTVIPNFLFV